MGGRGKGREGEEERVSAYLVLFIPTICLGYLTISPSKIALAFPASKERKSLFLKEELELEDVFWGGLEGRTSWFKLPAISVVLSSSLFGAPSAPVTEGRI